MRDWEAFFRIGHWLLAIGRAAQLRKKQYPQSIGTRHTHTNHKHTRAQNKTQNTKLAASCQRSNDANLETRDAGSWAAGPAGSAKCKARKGVRKGERGGNEQEKRSVI